MNSEPEPQSFSDVLHNLVEDLRPHFLAVGVKNERIDALLSDDVLDPTSLYDALVITRREEVAHYIYAISLVPQSMWDLYAARDIKNLRECVIRSRAERDLLKTFNRRLAVFINTKKAVRKAIDAARDLTDKNFKDFKTAKVDFDAK